MTIAVVTLEYEKETKNTIRFKEVERAEIKPVFGSLYINKEYAKDVKTIRVTIDIES